MELTSEELDYLVKVWAYRDRGMEWLATTPLGRILVKKGLIRPNPEFRNTASPELTPLGHKYLNALSPLEKFAICEKLELEACIVIDDLIPLLSKEELPIILASNYWFARLAARQKMEDVGRFAGSNPE